MAGVRAVPATGHNASERIAERGATEAEVTVAEGERFLAKFGRMGFRRNFAFDSDWDGRRYGTKQVEAYAAEENGWLVTTVIVRFF